MSEAKAKLIKNIAKAKTANTLPPNAKFALVASLYNQDHTDALCYHAGKRLREILPDCVYHDYRVPGAFEIPLACKNLLNKTPKPDAILALGVIIQGKTSHANLIAEAATAQIARLSVDYQTPISNAILLLKNETEAVERCQHEKLNRGIEAADCAIHMLALSKHICENDF